MCTTRRVSCFILAATISIAARPTALADVWHFEGVSSLLAFGGPPVYGVAGEQITITFDLNTADFFKQPVANPVFDYFVPNKTVPVHVAGSISGAFPNVSPIERVMALELTETQQNDLLAIGNEGGNLYDSFCRRSTCFNGDIRPNNPTEMFDLLERSILDANRWRLTTANPSIGLNGGNDRVVLDNDIVWTVSRTPKTPYTQIDIIADVDGQYTVQTGTLNTTATSALVGVDTMQREAWMEFPLASIPEGATIELAQLELRGFVSSGAPSLEIRRYSGNGTLELADGTVSSRIIAGTGPVSMDTGLLLDLDGAEIQQALSVGNSHLGLRLRGLDPIDYVGFYTKEASLGPPPTLVIRYSLPALAGDYNEDGSVSAEDYTIWRDRLGSATSLPNDDTPGVGFDDFTRWKSHFGESIVSGSAAAEKVPEPNLLYGISCWIGISVFLRRKRRFAIASASTAQITFKRLPD